MCEDPLCVQAKRPLCTRTTNLRFHICNYAEDPQLVPSCLLSDRVNSRKTSPIKQLAVFTGALYMWEIWFTVFWAPLKWHPTSSKCHMTCLCNAQKNPPKQNREKGDIINNTADIFVSVGLAAVKQVYSSVNPAHPAGKNTSFRRICKYNWSHCTRQTHTLQSNYSNTKPVSLNGFNRRRNRIQNITNTRQRNLTNTKPEKKTEIKTTRHLFITHIILLDVNQSFKVESDTFPLLHLLFSTKDILRKTCNSRAEY